MDIPSSDLIRNARNITKEKIDMANKLRLTKHAADVQNDD